MEHWFAATGATHPGAVFAAFIGDTTPEIDREKLAFTLAVKLAYIRVAVGIRTHWTAEIARIDDRHDDHERKLFRPCPKAVLRLLWQLDPAQLLFIPFSLSLLSSMG
jgi:hypothetical protein